MIITLFENIFKMCIAPEEWNTYISDHQTVITEWKFNIIYNDYYKKFKSDIWVCNIIVIPMSDQKR